MRLRSKLMRLLAQLVAFLWVNVLAAAALAQTSDYRGVMEFQEHCATCHEEPVAGSRALSRAALKTAIANHRLPSNDRR